MEKKRFLWTAALVGAVLVGLLLLGSMFTGNRAQNALSQQYSDNQVVLSTCLRNTDIAVQVATQQSKQVALAVQDIVAGRYEAAASGAASGQAALFSAVAENYPDIKAMNVPFDRLAAVAIGCQDEYKQAQLDLNEGIRRFEDWRTGTLWGFAIGWAYPTDNLIAHINDTNSFTGEEALWRMRTVVSYGKATDATVNQQLPEPNLFGTPAPSATPSK